MDRIDSLGLAEDAPHQCQCECDFVDQWNPRYGTGSLRASDGTNAVFADGHVQWINDSIDGSGINGDPFGTPALAAVLGRGFSAGLLESDEEGVEAWVAAPLRDHLNLEVGFSEKFSCQFDACGTDVAAGGPPHLVDECLVEAAARHAGCRGHVVHAKWLGEVLRDELQRPLDSAV